MKRLLDYLPTAPNGMALTDIFAESAQFPGMALVGDKAYVHYQAYKDSHDELKVGKMTENGLADVEVISGAGDVLYPVSLTVENTVWYAWSEAKDGSWSIYAKALKDGVWGDTILVDKGEAVLYPVLFVHQNVLHISWTRQHKNAADAVIGKLCENGVTDVEVVSISKEAYRINGCEGGDGNLYVTYDAYTNEGYHARARVKTADDWSDEIQVDTDDFNAISHFNSSIYFFFSLTKF